MHVQVENVQVGALIWITAFYSVSVHAGRA
jgi:hypothetical protein